VSLVHAVALPLLDEPAESVCGLLVVAMTDMRWHEVWGAPRCPTCERIAG
jgi:hypothetical protein